ncbi:MAG TPA: SH3 domain-containing protein [Clostridia bacterium]|nr:SH3 domain-containing protein [Clostridia bacterium]
MEKKKLNLSRKIMAPILIFLVLCLIPTVALAREGLVKGDYVNVRSGPATSYPRLGLVRQGTSFTLLESQGDWHKVQFASGLTGWIAGWLVELEPESVPQQPNPQPDVQPGTNYLTAIVTATSLNVRSGPGTNYSIVGGLSKGNVVTVLATSGDWLKIKTAQGLEGYVAGQYLQINQQGGTPALPPQEPVETPISSGLKCVVTASKANIRAGNSTNTAIVGSAVNGTVLEVLGEAGGWYNVKLPDGKIGWIAGWLVNLVQGKAATTITNVQVMQGQNCLNVILSLDQSAELIEDKKEDGTQLDLRFKNTRLGEGVPSEQLINQASLTAITASAGTEEAVISFKFDSPTEYIISKVDNTVTVTIFYKLTGLTVTEQEGITRVTLTANGPLSYSGKKDENNFWLTLLNVRGAANLTIPQVDNASLSGISLTQQTDGSTVLHLPLAQPLSSIEYKAESGPNSIIVTIVPQRLTGINWSRMEGAVKVTLQGIGRNDYKISTDDWGQASQTMVVSIADNLNIRSGPGTNYGVVGKVSKGAVMTVLAQSNDWYQIKTETGLAGYVASWLVEKKEATTGLMNNVPSAKPTKVIIDIPNTVYPELNKTYSVASGAVQTIRASQFTTKPYNTRVVIDLAENNTFTISYNPETKEITLLIKDPVLYGKTIVIDPGHGGSDPGAIGASGTYEKELNFKVAQLLYERLKQVGANVIMTRYGDQYVAYADRVQPVKSNNAHAFVSIHHNSVLNNPNASGVETYYYNGRTQSGALAQLIQKELANSLGIRNIGVKTANFYVIRETPESVPSVLTELAFISSPSDERLAKTAEFQNNAANAIYRGLTEYFR